jgi:hypothetical protein
MEAETQMIPEAKRQINPQVINRRIIVPRPHLLR